jgi:hypothetical protein
VNIYALARSSRQRRPGTVDSVRHEIGVRFECRGWGNNKVRTDWAGEGAPA